MNDFLLVDGIQFKCSHCGYILTTTRAEWERDNWSNTNYKFSAIHKGATKVYLDVVQDAQVHCECGGREWEPNFSIASNISLVFL